MFDRLRDRLQGNTATTGSSHHSHEKQNSEYQTPPGPPPGHYSSSKPEYEAPPGPPPGQTPHYPQQPHPTWDPPPYHDWTVIPDTAILPPPPSIGYDHSPTANSTAAEADRAWAWTDANPLWPAQTIHPATYAAIQNGQLALLKAPTYVGEFLPQREAGHWRCRTHRSCKDSSILSNLPLYCATIDSPLRTGLPKTVYFEIKVLGLNRNMLSFSEADAGIAIGFVAPPYPTFRLPGWERGSLGVHGDDGHRYVNDPTGGHDFTAPFKPGETVGIGMRFSVPAQPPSYGEAPQELDIEVFFTRNGKVVGSWNGHEELDAKKSVGGNVGLRGECDLFPAIGVFGGVDFDVFFGRNQWLYRPVN